MKPYERLEQFAGTSPLRGSGKSKLHCADFKYIVKAKHHDGSTFDLKYAFAVEYEDWHFVFTEHTGYFMFYKEDSDIEQWVGSNREDGEYVETKIDIQNIDEWESEGDQFGKK